MPLTNFARWLARWRPTILRARRTPAAREDIFDLFERVRAHPDFVFGTIFVLEDFARSVVPDDQSGRPTRSPSAATG